MATVYFTGDQVAFFDNVNNGSGGTLFTGVDSPFLATDLIRIELADSSISPTGEFDDQNDMFILSMTIIRDGVEYEMDIADGKIKNSGGGNNTEQGDTFFMSDTQFSLPSGGPFSSPSDDQRMVFSTQVSLTSSSVTIPRFTNVDYNGDGDFTDADERGDGNFNINTSVVCFGSETMIATDRGEIAIKHLSIGDLVLTSDAGMQPVRWIGRRTLDIRTLDACPNLRPIRIRRGALGNDTPSADLLVSPQHRMLVRSTIAQRMFNSAEVLVASKHLLEIDGIEIAEDVRDVEYVHFLLDDHYVVVSNGAESESLYTGSEALKSVGQAALNEIYEIFPDLRDRNADHRPKSARRSLTGREGRKLAYRHARNSRALLE